MYLAYRGGKIPYLFLISKQVKYINGMSVIEKHFDLKRLSAQPGQFDVLYAIDILGVRKNQSGDGVLILNRQPPKGRISVTAQSRQIYISLRCRIGSRPLPDFY